MNAVDGGSTSTRGSGIGLELTATMVRGVRIDRDTPGRVASSVELEIPAPGDEHALYETLVHARARLGVAAVPTRVAFFPAGSTMHRVEATGLDTPHLTGLRHRLADDHGITSTIVIDNGFRRFLLAMQWDHVAALKAIRIVDEAGFSDVSIEPAPLALHRVVPRDLNVMRRESDPDLTWICVRDRDLPMTAATVASATTVFPALTTAQLANAAFHTEAVTSRNDLMLGHDRVAAELQTAGESSVTEPDLAVLDRRYPTASRDDPRAASRVAVALGAALGAGGLGGRDRSIDLAMPNRSSLGSAWRPWTVEEVAEVDVPAPSTSWWQRFLRWLEAIGVRRRPRS